MDKIRQTTCPAADLGLLIMRVMLGVVMTYHGSQKLFSWFGGGGMEGFASALSSMNVPLPALSAYLAAGAEFFGGAALLLGLATRLAAIPVLVTMLVAALVAHWGAFGAPQGMEYPLTLASMALGIGLLGPGRFSLDSLLAGRLPCCGPVPCATDRAAV
jgi:putative oxidoreductase